ncbi:MAG: zinc ribbon domain-containing protein [Clostridium sp.]|nr:zinc ribbon domain-containing protein [Clostridium sp.]
MDLFESINNFNGVMIDPMQIVGFASNITSFIAVIIFALSIVHCFYGYKLLKWWISFIGFILFGIAGYGVYYNFNGDMNNAIICGLVVGVIGALISFSLYRAGVIVMSFGAGYLTGYTIFTSMKIAIAFGVIIGILALLYMKPVLIITIAVSSGILAGKNLALILGAGSDTGIMFSILFAVLGTLFQWKVNIGKIRFRKSRKKNNKRRRKSRGKKSFELSINGIKDTFYKLKNKVRFDDGEEDDYDYYDAKTEFMPVDNNESSGDKTEFMPKANKEAEGETEESKLFRKINEKAKDEFNVNDILNDNEDKMSHGHINSKGQAEVRCPRCNKLCSTSDKFCKNCGEKL